MTVLTQLEALEAEAVYVMREVAAEFERPVLLFSGGKDSIVLLRLAEKAFRPARFPCPILHIDTGHNFAEVLEFRDRRVAELGEQLIVARVQDSIDSGRAHEDGPSRNRLQTVTLLDALARGPVRRGVRRRAARRGARAGQGARAVLPRRARPVGAAQPAARGLGSVQHGRAARRERARVPDLQLDRARRLALHRGRGARGAVDLLRPRARGLRARRDAVRGLGALAAAQRRRRCSSSASATAPWAI